MQRLYGHGLRAALLPGFLYLLSGSAAAQDVISGVVTDTSGATVPGAKLELRSGRGQTLQHAVAAGRGEFSFAGVSAGQYFVVVPAIFGFAPYRQAVRVSQHGVTSVAVRLVVASVEEQVTVGADASGVAVDAAENRDQISADAHMLEKVPVFDQDYIAALTPFLDQGAVGTSGVTLIVDGVEMKGTGVSASAIAEARINNDPYSVETNRPGRGRIEIITKPGTAQVHGSLTFTFRDSVFDAKNYFAVTKPFEQKRIYEGSVTGPLGRVARTTFLISGTRQEDNLQAIVHAVTASGVISANVPQPVYNTEFAMRVARDVSDSHRMSLQYNVADTITRNAGVGGLVLAEAGSNQRAREDDVVFNDRYVVSPTLLNQLQLFFEKDFNPTRSVTTAQRMVVDGGFTSGGAQSDLFNTENNLKINDIVSWSHKRHYVKFAVNIPNLSRRAWEDRSNRLGTFSYNSVANYVAQRPYLYTQQTGPGRTTFWMNEIGSFVQDQISLRSNLQVAVGLRYDWQTYFRSAHDFAPRGSIAYSSNDHRAVIRAGAGLFYDRSGAAPMADLKRYNGVIVRSVQILNPSYPNAIPASVSVASLPTNVVEESPATHLPYALNYSLGVERQVNKKLTVAMTYHGSKGFDQFRSRDVNAPMGPGYAARPNASLGVVRQIESAGTQMQNAVDVTVSGKGSRWFSGIAQYTFSHTNNDTSGIAWFPANQYDLRGEYGRADFDQRHHFNMLGTINEDHWLNLGVAAKVYSGVPYTETSGVDAFNTGLLNARPAGISRNSLQSASTEGLDLRWNRDIPLAKGKGDFSPVLSLAVDGFNVTNRTNYIGGASSYVGNVQSALFGQPTAAAPARRLQFTAHFKF